MFQNHIQLNLFLFSVEEEEKEGKEVRQRSKVKHQAASERKRYVIFILYSTK